MFNQYLFVCSFVRLYNTSTHMLYTCCYINMNICILCCCLRIYSVAGTNDEDSSRYSFIQLSFSISALSPLSPSLILLTEKTSSLQLMCLLEALQTHTLSLSLSRAHISSVECVILYFRCKKTYSHKIPHTDGNRASDNNSAMQQQQTLNVLTVLSLNSVKTNTTFVDIYIA